MFDTEEYLKSERLKHEKSILNALLEFEKVKPTPIVLIANPSLKGFIAEVKQKEKLDIKVLWSRAVEPDKVYQVLDKELAQAIIENTKE